MPATVTENGKAFGSFGVVLTVIGYLFVMITLSLVCAVFSRFGSSGARPRKLAARVSQAPPQASLSRDPNDRRRTE
jgi:hypothetical protein